MSEGAVQSCAVQLVAGCGPAGEVGRADATVERPERAEDAAAERDQ